MGATAQTGIFGGHGGLGEHLGKNLSHHQVIQAVNQVRTSNTPLVDIGKAVLSATGGHPKMVRDAVSLAKFTLPVSPFHRRQIARTGVNNQLKHSVSQVSKKSA